MDVPLVKVKQGILRGAVSRNIEGGDYIFFQGIPYAEPPVGKLRFKDPRPPLAWTGIRNAIEKGKKAAQIDSKTASFVGGDDCLYLNVATNSLSEKKPVMVWIHGGGFATSSGSFDHFGPDYLLKHDIVFVSFNYRLGIFGFLNMEIQDCAGNQGLKDQVSALTWIQENIDAFGGDKNNVTIFGESAGSASIHYLCISPHVKGLFHKAICQSGVATNPWAFQTSNKDLAFKIATALGKDSSDPEETVKFLCTISAQKVLETQMEILRKQQDYFDFTLPFVPSLDTKSSNPLLPQSLPALVQEDVRVPLIIGFNSHEGMRFTGARDKVFEMYNDKFEEIFASKLDFIDKANLSEFAREVKEFYYKKNPITIKERESLIQYQSDLYFVNGIQLVAERQMQRDTPTYFYRFSYNPDSSLVGRDPINVNIKGADHADENYFLFYRPLLGNDRQLKKGTKDYLMMQRMTKMWTDFANTGEPTPTIDDLITIKWPSLSASQKNYLEITDQLLPGEDPAKESWDLWKPILKHTNLSYMINTMKKLLK